MEYESRLASRWVVVEWDGGATRADGGPAGNTTAGAAGFLPATARRGGRPCSWVGASAALEGAGVTLGRDRREAVFYRSHAGVGISLHLILGATLVPCIAGYHGTFGIHCMRRFVSFVVKSSLLSIGEIYSWHFFKNKK